MMLPLEIIVKDITCVVKLRIMRNPRIILGDKFDKCYFCTKYQGGYNCDLYKPYNFTFPVRVGAL